MIMKDAVVAGYERLAAWADLLDSINVYPVADGDTGRNLVVSLAPLRNFPREGKAAVEKLLMSARGNSGNIAARFFSSLLEFSSMDDLADCVKKGAAAAWSAVDTPRKGTMLTLFEDLSACMNEFPVAAGHGEKIVERLDASVRSTRDMLPRLREAGVVDSGALGMFLFFEGFFLGLDGKENRFVPVTERFREFIRIDPGFRETEEDGFCVDMVLKISEGADGAASARELSSMGESVVVIPEKNYLKVHLHTDDPEKVRFKNRRHGLRGPLVER